MSNVLEGIAGFYGLVTHGRGDKPQLVQRDAYKSCLANSDEVHFLVNHEERDIVATRSSGALKLWTRQDTLFFELTVPLTPEGSHVLDLVKHQGYSGMSMGFRYGSGWGSAHIENINGQQVTVVDEAVLQEVSLCRFGAQSKAYCNLVLPTLSLAHQQASAKLKDAFKQVQRALVASESVH